MANRFDAAFDKAFLNQIFRTGGWQFGKHSLKMQWRWAYVRWAAFSKKQNNYERWIFSVESAEITLFKSLTTDSASCRWSFCL